MIRERLDQNGIEIEYISNKNVLAIRLNKTYYRYSKDDLRKPMQIIEDACRQYVKENGFKLEWFDKDTKGHIDFWGFRKTVECLVREDDLYSKLIAWLYANDIEVIN